MSPSKPQATKLKQDFTNLFSAEVSAGRDAVNLREKLKQPKEEDRAVIVFVLNAVIKLLMNAAYLVRSSRARSVKLS